MYEEIQLRDRIEAAGVGAIQEVLTWDRHEDKAENKLDCPYIALEWADGKSLDKIWTNDLPQEDRRKVIKGMVKTIVNMLKVQRRGM